MGTYTGTDEADSIVGSTSADTIYGYAGNDTLIGGEGADSMIGGADNDLYYVDNTSDVVVENSSEGTDTISSSVSYTLSDNVEDLILTGTDSINGYGNDLNNVITGNLADNIIDGGAGADTMIGGDGNETYYVDNIGDVVTEVVDEGIDLVSSSINYTLGDNVENLTLTGTDSLTGTGNELDNVITGNSGDNTLTGGEGDDTLIGGEGADSLIGWTGDDVYYVDDASDEVVESSDEGTDLVYTEVSYTLDANVENVTVEAVSKINGIDVDLRSITREYGLGEEEISKEELLRIAKNAGFKAKIKDFPLEDSKKYPLPAIFILKNNTYGVILKINYEQNKLLVFIPEEKTTKEITYEEFYNFSIGEIIFFNHKILDEKIKFGFKWFYLEILKYKQVMAEVMLGSFVVQIFGLVTPLFTQVILDKVIVHRSMSTLNVLGIAFVVVALFEFTLNLARNYIFIHTANKIDAKLGAKLFKHLFALPFIYFESRKVGNIIARVRELDQIREFITNKSVSVIIDLFFSFVFLIVMFVYSRVLTFIVLGIVALIAVLYLVVTPELRARLENKFQMGAQSNSYLVESTTGVQTVKSLSIEGTMQRKWEEYLGKYVRSGFNLSIMSSAAGSLSKLFQKIMTIAILWIGVILVIRNDLTIGQLIAFQMFANQFIAPVMRLVNLWNEFQQALLGVDRLGDILNHPVEITSNKAITLPKINGFVRAENLSFKYAPNAPLVLDKINFNINPGQCVGIVGRSGSGKSTIAKLIQKLYLPFEGTIYIDNVDIRQINPIWLRHNIGIVLQENYLFSGTIRENIAMPKTDAPIELIIQASQIAGAHQFISEMPEGYDTIVGERGSSLSGGQRQRIAITRALITNPQIIIFDEATSALDYESENIIMKNMETIKRGRTMFVIAHRLSTVKNCDVIIALDKGRIIEAGSHDELMAKNSYYYNLYIQQRVLR